jgi:Fe-Mn family superoxide dismutase
MPVQLPKLPYAYDALEPHMDAKTVEIHYSKHHQTYTDNLNKALTSANLQTDDIDKLLADLNSVPESVRTAVRNHGGGYANHNLYWEVMAPKAGGEPAGELAEAINKAFGDFKSFKEKLQQAAQSHFGSGWGWLNVAKDGSLVVNSTANQDSPISQGLKPILVVDVWEHAYYLKYQNRRADFITAWWNLVNWKVVAEKYAAALKQGK